jgi:prostaglandin-H2 D-isomerase / glutathione transferase
MSKIRLTYFDSAASRGEECRIALHLAGVDFEDVRIKRTDWPALKPKTPYGGMPFIEFPGRPVLGQCNAILTLIGRLHGLHPTDAFEAARHEAMMQHVEDLRGIVSPTLRIQDPEKKAAREAMAATALPAWATHAEANITEGPFFGGSKLHVVDIKLYMAVRWFIGGAVDHVPATIFSGYPKLMGVYEAVRDHEGVKAWVSRQ